MTGLERWHRSDKQLDPQHAADNAIARVLSRLLGLAHTHGPAARRALSGASGATPGPQVRTHCFGRRVNSEDPGQDSQAAALLAHELALGQASCFRTV
jgi:hypothetical protein